MLFLFVGTVFLGNSVVGWQGQQLRMDVLLHALPARWRRGLDVFADLTVIVVSLILIVLGWPAIQMLAEFDQRSQAADIPLVHSAGAGPDRSRPQRPPGRRPPDRADANQTSRSACRPRRRFDIIAGRAAISGGIRRNPSC